MWWTGDMDVFFRFGSETALRIRLPTTWTPVRGTTRGGACPDFAAHMVGLLPQGPVRQETDQCSTTYGFGKFLPSEETYCILWVWGLCSCSGFDLCILGVCFLLLTHHIQTCMRLRHTMAFAFFSSGCASDWVLFRVPGDQKSS